MTPRTQVIGILIAALMLTLVLELVLRRQLRIGYSLIWLAIGFGVMALVAAPPLVNFLSNLLGVTSPRSLLFTAGIAFSLWILLEHSLTLTKLWRQDKDIAQKHALLEWQVRDLQNQLDQLRAAQRPPLQLDWEETSEPQQSAYAMSFDSEDGVHEPQ